MALMCLKVGTLTPLCRASCINYVDLVGPAVRGCGPLDAEKLFLRRSLLSGLFQALA